jgi:hypothetical protein
MAKRERKRSGTRSTLEVFADLAAIVATVLALFTFPGVERAHSIMEGSRPAPPATTASQSAHTHTNLIPAVCGLLEAEAAVVLAKHGFEVQVYYAPATDGADVGRVLGQAPTPGSSSARGALVAIVVGSATGH